MGLSGGCCTSAVTALLERKPERRDSSVIASSSSRIERFKPFQDVRVQSQQVKGAVSPGHSRVSLQSMAHLLSSLCSLMLGSLRHQISQFAQLDIALRLRLQSKRASENPRQRS